MFFFSAISVHAMNRVTIPDNYKYQSVYGKLNLTSTTYAGHTWHGVAGQVYDSTTISNAIPNTYGAKLFTVPTVRSGFTYTDFLDVRFQNVGRVNDRKLNAVLHVDSCTFGAVQTNMTNGDKFASSQAGIFFVAFLGRYGTFLWTW